MRKKVCLTMVCLLLCLGVFADDSWLRPIKNIIVGTEYEIVLNTDYMSENGMIKDLHKKLGLRLNYRFTKTNFVLGGGMVEPYLQTDIYDIKTNKSIASSKVKTYYISCRYILFEDQVYYGSRFCVGAGLAQERFRWDNYSGIINAHASGMPHASFNKNQMMPYVSLSGELKTSRHTAISVDIWRYLGRTDFPFNGDDNHQYFIRQGKTQIMFFFVYKIS